MTTRNITKSLAGMEDLAQGVGIEQQARGDSIVNIGRIDIPYSVSSIEQMSALDVTKFTKARVYSGATVTNDYIYDPLATEGEPSTGPGKWVIDVNSVTETIKEKVSIAELASVDSTVLVGNVEASEVGKSAKLTGNIGNSDILLISAFTNNQSALDIFMTVDGSNLVRLGSSPVYVPQSGVLRDPSLIKYGDYYYVVHSNVPSDVSFETTKYSIARSKNLIDWDFVTDIELSGLISGIGRAWAPEWFVDDDGSVYVIIATSVPNDNNFTTTLIKHSGADLSTIDTPIFLDLPTGYIDGTIIKEDGDYVMFIKNESTKFIERFQSSNLMSGYVLTGVGDWAGWGSGIEGPSVIRLSDGSVRIYFDAYTPTNKYFLSSSTSAKSNAWSAKAELSNFSGVIRHFSAYVVDTNALASTLNAAILSKIPVDESGEAEFIADGTVRAAQSVTASSANPLNSTFQRYQSDADYAIFQARAISEIASGVDFVNRRSLGYASVEVLVNGSVKEVIKFIGTSGKAEFPNGVVTEDWKNPSYQNGWGDGIIPLSYKASSEGLVKFAGNVSGGTTTFGTVIFNIPVGWRPDRDMVFPVVDNDLSFGSVVVEATGNVLFSSGTNAKLDLSNISYYRTQ